MKLHSRSTLVTTSRTMRVHNTSSSEAVFCQMRRMQVGDQERWHDIGQRTTNVDLSTDKITYLSIDQERPTIAHAAYPSTSCHH